MATRTTRLWGKYLLILLFVVGVFIAAYVVAGRAAADPGYQDDSGLPTVPPPLPTQVVNGDGSRMDCTPSGNYCWPAR